MQEKVGRFDRNRKDIQLADESIIVAVRKYLSALSDEGLTLSFGVLFGSHVTGHVYEWSDIDLMVVAKRYDSEYKHTDVSLLWKVAALLDPRIEHIPCGEKQWEEDDGTPIIEIVRREGEIILLNNKK